MDKEIIDKKKVHPAVVRQGMQEVEARISKLPDAKFGDDCAPLKHSFGDGLYIREITMKKGLLIVSKLHKTTHPYFVLKGDASVLTEEGIVRIKAPFSGITKAGTKRVLYIHEDTVWTTVHATKETELEKIEGVVIAKSYDELPDEVKKGMKELDENKVLKFIETTKKTEEA